MTTSLHDQTAAAMDDVLGETAETRRDTETDGPLQRRGGRRRESDPRSGLAGPVLRSEATHA